MLVPPYPHRLPFVISFTLTPQSCVTPHPQEQPCPFPLCGHEPFCTPPYLFSGFPASESILPLLFCPPRLFPPKALSPRNLVTSFSARVPLLRFRCFYASRPFASFLFPTFYPVPLCTDPSTRSVFFFWCFFFYPRSPPHVRRLAVVSFPPSAAIAATPSDVVEHFSQGDSILAPQLTPPSLHCSSSSCVFFPQLRTYWGKYLFSVVRKVCPPLFFSQRSVSTRLSFFCELCIGFSRAGSHPPSFSSHHLIHAARPFSLIPFFTGNGFFEQLAFATLSRTFVVFLSPMTLVFFPSPKYTSGVPSPPGF